MQIENTSNLDVWLLLDKNVDFVLTMMYQPKDFVQWTIRTKHDFDRKAYLIEIAAREFANVNKNLSLEDFQAESWEYGFVGKIFDAIFLNKKYRHLILESIKPTKIETFAEVKAKGIVAVKITKKQLIKMAFNCHGSTCSMSKKVGVWVNKEIKNVELTQDYEEVYKNNRDEMYKNMKSLIPEEKHSELWLLLNRMDIRNIHNGNVI